MRAWASGFNVGLFWFAAQSFGFGDSDSAILGQLQ